MAKRVTYQPEPWDYTEFQVGEVVRACEGAGVPPGNYKVTVFHPPSGESGLSQGIIFVEGYEYGMDASDFTPLVMEKEKDSEGRYIS